MKCRCGEEAEFDLPNEKEYGVKFKAKFYDANNRPSCVKCIEETNLWSGYLLIKRG